MINYNNLELFIITNYNIQIYLIIKITLTN